LWNPSPEIDLRPPTPEEPLGEDEHGPAPFINRNGTQQYWDGLRISCSDGNTRNCYPVLAAWIADYQEHVIIARLQSGHCPRCEIPVPETGHEMPISKKKPENAAGEVLSAPSRSVDWVRCSLRTEIGRAMLPLLGLKPEINSLWCYPLCNVY